MVCFAVAWLLWAAGLVCCCCWFGCGDLIVCVGWFVGLDCRNCSGFAGCFDFSYFVYCCVGLGGLT